MANGHSNQYIDFKDKQIADEMYEWLEDKGFLCSECNRIISSVHMEFRSEGYYEKTSYCNYCGATYTE